MALRAGYYGIKRGLKAKLAEIAGAWDATVSSIFPRDEQIVLGAKNLLDLSVSEIKSLNPQGTWDGNTYTRYGVSYTFNSDRTISVSAASAATDTSIVILKQNVSCKDNILNGCPTGGSGSTYKLVLFKSGDSKEDTGNGVTISDTTARELRLVIYPAAGALSKTFKPMLRLATDPDGTYAPPSKTNQQLTTALATDEEAIENHKTTINAIISAATGAADFAAFKAAMEALTPLTRSLSREATPEVVEPEEKEVEEASEPVTKKRTTKKTVKEGE